MYSGDGEDMGGDATGLADQVAVPLFKKVDRRVCYKGITLLSLYGKVYSGVLERRIRWNLGYRPEKGGLPSLGEGRDPAPSGEIQYLRVLFTSEGKMERKIDRWIGAGSAVMRTLRQSIDLPMNLCSHRHL